MLTTFKEIRRLQGERVRMQFDDGREVVAVLLCATKDIDGSKHLIYDHVESDRQVESSDQAAPSSSAQPASSVKTGFSPAAKSCSCCYADAKTLVEIGPVQGAGARRPTRIGETLPPRPAAHDVAKAWHTGA